MIGIIGAMDTEVELLLSWLTNKEEVQVGNGLFYTGLLGGQEVVVCRSGIGKVAAAICALRMTSRFGASLLINTGVAGGLRPGMRPGDCIVAREALHHDFDATGFGYAKGNLCDPTDRNAFTVFKADPAWVEKAMAAAPQGMELVPGLVATGDCFVASTPRKKEIYETFGADVVEMEGAAIAQAAVAEGVPFLILRIASDLADENAQSITDEEVTRLAGQMAQLIKNMMEAL